MILLKLLWSKSGGALFALAGLGIALLGAYLKGRAGGAAKVKRKWADERRKTSEQLSAAKGRADSARNDDVSGDLRSDDGNKRGD